MCVDASGRELEVCVSCMNTSCVCVHVCVCVDASGRELEVCVSCMNTSCVCMCVCVGAHTRVCQCVWMRARCVHKLCERQQCVWGGAHMRHTHKHIHIQYTYTYQRIMRFTQRFTFSSTHWKTAAPLKMGPVIWRSTSASTLT